MTKNEEKRLLDHLEKNEVWYTTDFYEKGEKIDSAVCSQMLSNKLGIEMAYNTTKKRLEHFAIDGGGFTTFTGLFAIGYEFGTKKFVFMITYKPTLNYEIITNKAEMFNYLHLTKTKAEVA